ncbi:ATP-binding cassette domain-containing protein [Actinomadura sp. HBU206391]|uniref:ATP-binding cassette domain-containing protein n=1 Tax=Actinomadura sp. HBU206391 TaxID=2731692 RepID=UPI00164F06CF|nr:ATP-binding cassette domain-containing protein [Actinomadura sp. HBU206391]MBC6458024.1 ATP-binding cassette domain-containing protein [Actinomadura sp. HBU206391]
MIADVSTIVARGMGIRRGGRWILRPAVFGIAGGVIGFAGPPGVGKTSLLATFATLRRPHVGALEVLGHDTGNSTGLRSARELIGYLPGDFAWAANLRVGDFVGYAAYYKRMPAGAVEAALDRFELRDAAGMDLAMLPADMRLRAGLAATCVHEPDLVLLDEPLATIGDAMGDKAMELWPVIRTLAPTVLVTAPTVDGLVGRCDRVFTLARGRLTELPAEPRRALRTGQRTAAPVRSRRAPARSRPQRIGAGV